MPVLPILQKHALLGRVRIRSCIGRGWEWGVNCGVVSYAGGGVRVRIRSCIGWGVNCEVVSYVGGGVRVRIRSCLGWGWEWGLIVGLVTV